MRIAMWLLQRFGVLERNESLAGDLAEERANGRPAWWFWGQTLAAVADVVARDLRDHWLLTLRAIGTGWAASYLILRILDRIPLLFAPFHLFSVTYTLMPVAVGWIVAQTHRAHQAALVLAFAASVVLCAPWTCVICVGDGASDFSGKVPLACLGVLGAMMGGLLARPKRTGLRTPTP
jgi:hypothetical protein